MNKNLPKAYEAKDYEDKIYAQWEDSGFFNPDNLKVPADAPTYTVILPPPNITDKLHLGHAAMLAIEDLFVRYRRLQGERVLWLPGTDHAAIATQTVVEKQLQQETGQTRHDLGREAFLQRVNDFITVTQAIILKQIRKMGASLDWSRLAFTLDENRKAAVKTMFIQMYDVCLINRGDRIVNWCPHCQSTLADDEVEYVEQKTKLYTFKYDANFPIAIATTRPETKLGDTAVAVNPKDERYAQYIGQEFTADFLGQTLKLKIIADHNVDMTFGTGALGVTPAHSMADWLMAQEHDLPLIKVIDEQAKIKPGFGDFSNQTAVVARQMVVDQLKDRNLLVSEEEIDNSLSVCYRCDTPIEPLTSLQWFVAVDQPVDRLHGQSLKQAAIAAVEDQSAITFIPERFAKRYLDWMHNLRDWCISRQIWFGHRLPVWYRDEQIYVGQTAPSEAGWQQDSDTLDTWFSSGMWTFSTLGWPRNLVDGHKRNDLARYHPTQLMETGYEIITLWISRMIMMSLFALQEVPFSTVYLHGLILDKNGKKMSKSKGNGIDPLDMIAAYGTDAVRLSLLVGTTPGNDVRMFADKIAGYRNFVNKLWNISRFMLGTISQPQIDIVRPQPVTLADHWILSKLDRVVVQVTQGLENYDFSSAGDQLKEFTWNELADWYLEIAKIEGDKEFMLNYILNTILKLWHPFMPFVTEAIWNEIYGSERLLLVEKWPQSPDQPEPAVADMEVVKHVITAIRQARSLNKLQPTQLAKAVIYAADQTVLLQGQAQLIQRLRTSLKEIEIKEQGEKLSGAIYISLGSIDIYLLADLDPVKEKERLTKAMAKLDQLIAGTEAKINNPEFLAKAPTEIVEQEKTKLADWRLEQDKLRQQLGNL
ncbi:MAG: valine--tRNA ligase [bacterium]